MEISRALGRKIPFATHLGIQLVENGGGRTVLMPEVRPELMSRFEVAHGADGKLIGTASGTFMVRHKGGRRPAGETRADE